jgi:tetratricopeptide (TPR) repeat protein
VLRATLLLPQTGVNQQDVIVDLDEALSREPTNLHVYKKPQVLALRGKADMLRGDPAKVLDDLWAAVTANPDDYSDVFRSSGVKPEEDSDPTALNKADYDALVSKFPTDFRPYVFRGLFHLFFVSFGEQAFAPALADLRRATEVGPSSALARYFLGSAVFTMSYHTAAAWSDASDVTGAPGGYRGRVRTEALVHFQRAAELDSRLAEARAKIAAVCLALKRYPEAIAAFDRVLELRPNDAGAFTDRGLAKAEIRDDYGAYSDFSSAIRLVLLCQIHGFVRRHPRFRTCTSLTDFLSSDAWTRPRRAR